MDPFSNDGSGWNTLAEFETGAVATMNQRTPLTGGDGSLWFRMPEYSAYFNDSWNVTPRLTHEPRTALRCRRSCFQRGQLLGRTGYELSRIPPRDAWVDAGNPQSTVSGGQEQLCTALGSGLSTTDKTVLRGGYGVFYETGRFKFLDQMFWNSPGYGGITFDSATHAADPAQAFYKLNDVFPAAVSIEKGTWPVPLGDKGGVLYTRQSPQTVDKNSAITPYIQRWSLDIQRELGKSTVATLGYVGSGDTKLTTQYDLNLPAQGVYMTSDDFYNARPLTAIAPDRWEAINAVHHNRSNNYHALNAQLKTQNWHNLTSILNYTWSKQMDTFFGESGEGGVQIHRRTMASGVVVWTVRRQPHEPLCRRHCLRTAGTQHDQSLPARGHRRVAAQHHRHLRIRSTGDRAQRRHHFLRLYGRRSGPGL